MKDDIGDVTEFEKPSIHPIAKCKWFNDGNKEGFNCPGCFGEPSYHQCTHPNPKASIASTTGKICRESLQHYRIDAGSCPFYEGDIEDDMGVRPRILS